MDASTRAGTARRVTCCGCAQQCGLEVAVADGRVAAIHGDRLHPVSAGFVCPKGTDATEFIYRPDRLLKPLKRVGPRGAGHWQPVDWDTALDDIAARLAELRARHGPETLAYSYGTFRGGDWAVGERFMNRFGSPNSCGQDKICSGPTALGEALTYGMGPTIFTWPVPGVTNTVVVWGMRPSASAPLLWKAIFAARKAGTRLVVIDPVRTREASHADLWLQVRPNGDGALALALLKSVVEQGACDLDFVARETVGFDALAAHLASLDGEALARMSGIDAAAIAALAKSFGGGARTLVSAGNGLCQGGSGAVQLARAIACLVAVTGNVGRSGGHALGGPPRDVLSNGATFGSQYLDAAQRAKRLGADTYPWLGRGYADMDAALARRWYDQRDSLGWLATAHEPSLWRAISDGEPYPVTALIVQSHNPLGANPNARAVDRALHSERLALTVVQDLFMTPTAALADYVLPAAHWLEKPYLSVGLGFLAGFGDFVAAGPAAVAPPGACRDDYALWRDLARRLGDDDWPARLEDFYQQCVAPAGLDFATLAGKATPLFGEAARRPDLDSAASVNRPAYGTPSGRIELDSSLLTAWGQPSLPVVMNPASAAAAQDYPLVLTTGGRFVDGFHESAQQAARFRRHHPHPIAYVHPHAAGRAGIADGAWFTLATPHGTVRQVARLTTDVAEDVVVADRWWYPEGTGKEDDPYGLWAHNVNVCTSDAAGDCDPVLGTWLLRGMPCRVEA